MRKADPSISEDRAGGSSKRVSISRHFFSIFFYLRKVMRIFFLSDFVKSVLQLIGRKRLNGVDSLTTRGRVRVTNSIDSSCVDLFILLLEDSRKFVV